LKSGGRALVQTITIDESRFERYRSSTDFIQQYIFPGGMLPSPVRFCQQAEKQGFAVQDQYAFGKDYAETLRRWNHGFEAQREHISRQGFGAEFQRIWQLYFAYCEAGFDEGSTDVMQFTLQKNA
jgi:cyclopropane-fatty-acyl-phospholipid synthase